MGAYDTGMGSLYGDSSGGGYDPSSDPFSPYYNPYGSAFSAGANSYGGADMQNQPMGFTNMDASGNAPGFSDPYGNFVDNPAYDPNSAAMGLPLTNQPDPNSLQNPWAGSPVFSATGDTTLDANGLPLINQPGLALPNPSYYPAPAPFETGGPVRPTNPTNPTNPTQQGSQSSSASAKPQGQPPTNNYVSLGQGSISPISSSLPGPQVSGFQPIDIPTSRQPQGGTPPPQNNSLMSQIMWRALNRRNNPAGGPPGSSPYDTSAGI